MYSPASTLSIYFPSENVFKQRKNNLIKKLKNFYNQEIIFYEESSEAIYIETESSTDHWVLNYLPRGLSKADFFLFIVYKNGKHENVCLAIYRKFIRELIDDRIVDTVQYPKGLPRNTPKWFFTLYKPSQFIGYRPYLLLEILNRKYFPNTGDFINDANDIIQGKWNELNEDQTINIIDFKGIYSFLEKNKSFAILKGLLVTNG